MDSFWATPAFLLEGDRHQRLLSSYIFWRIFTRITDSIYRELENYASAKKAYNTAINKNPEDFVLYVEQGDVLRESEDDRGAIDFYNRAIELNPNHPWAYMNQGVVYKELKQYDKAISNYNRILVP